MDNAMLLILIIGIWLILGELVYGFYDIRKYLHTIAADLQTIRVRDLNWGDNSDGFASNLRFKLTAIEKSLDALEK